MKRPDKGHSIVTFPNNYVIIDIETTGLSPEWDSIIEVSAIKYENNSEISRFSSLVQPDDDEEVYIDSFIEQLTGITNEMISTAPKARDIFPEFYEFLGSNLLIGHNVNFDINFLYDNFTKYISKPLLNDFIDTRRIFCRLHPELPHHRLKELAAQYNIDYSGAHRSIVDCEITNSCYEKLKQEIANSFEDVNEFFKSFDYVGKQLKAADISTDQQNFDISHPLYKKVCVFTGALERMPRRQAMQIVADFGGINGDSITKKTNFLILGNTDYSANIKDGKSSKQKKAEKLKLEGYDIEIIPENVFYTLAEID